MSIDFKKDDLALLDPNLLPYSYSVLNANHEYCFLNQTARRMLGFRVDEDIRGLTHLDIKCRAAEISHMWIEQEKIMLDNDIDSMKFISYQCCAKNNWMLVLGEKKIIKRNGEKYIICYITDITNCNLLDISRFLNEGETFNTFSRKQFCYTIAENHYLFRFTKRQAECLFYLLRGKSSKQIGIILNISQRTVEEHVEKVRYMMGCASKNQLVEKLILSGFMNFIPQSLFEKK